MTTTFISPLQRMIAVIGAVLITASLFSGAAANAQTRSGPFYQATLAAATDTSRTIAGSVLWSCNLTSCVAPRGTSRPVVMCARLVREVGAVSAFSAGGQPLSEDDLARCNAAA